MHHVKTNQHSGIIYRSNRTSTEVVYYDGSCWWKKIKNTPPIVMNFYEKKKPRALDNAPKKITTSIPRNNDVNRTRAGNVRMHFYAATCAPRYDPPKIFVSAPIGFCYILSATARFIACAVQTPPAGARIPYSPPRA